MTSLVAWSLILIIMIFTFIAIEVARASRSWIVLILSLCFLGRILLSIVLDGGLKYVFVVDSLSYEYKGWLMAQPWISDDIMRVFLPAGNTIVNSYEVFISWVFKVFGKEPLIATICNCALSTATIGLLSLMYRCFFADSSRENSNVRFQSSLVLLIVLSLYPSFLIWSATNTRDPLYFFSCTLFYFCFLMSFSKRSDALFHVRVLCFFGSGFAMWLVLGVRSYVNGLFLLSIAAGFILHFIARYLRWSVIGFYLLLTVLLTGVVTQALFPASVSAALENLTTTRLSFANLNLLDSVAKSSFGLEYTFGSIWDVYIFLPNALAHYFFGPFPWEISSSVQAVSLIEASAIYLMILPTLKGIRNIYRRAPFETITLLCFAMTFALAQSLVISNMGTIFRHRTLPFLFISIFTCEGLRDVAKENFPALFPA